MTIDRPFIAPRSFGRFNYVSTLALYQREIWRNLKSWPDTLLDRGFTTLLYLIIFSVAFDHIAGTPAEMSVAAFLAPGLAIYAASERAFEAPAFSLIFDKHEHMIDDILMAPLSAGERVLAYAAAAVTTGLAAGIIVLIVGCLYSGTIPGDPLLGLGYMILSSSLFALLGIGTGLFSTRWDHYSAILSFLVLPLSFLSGTFYAVASLPETGRNLVSLNPVYHLIDGFRWAITGFGETQSPIGALVTTGLIITFALGLIRLFARGVRLKP